jgi:hypothetical protein
MGKVMPFKETESGPSPISVDDLQAMVVSAARRGQILSAVLLIETADTLVDYVHPTSSETAARGMVRAAYDWLCRGDSGK